MKKTEAAEPAALCFTQLEVAQYELARARHQLSARERGMKQAEIEISGLRHELFVLRKQQELVQLGFSLGEAQTKLKKMTDALGEKYKIDMTKIAYDDVTGKVTPL